MHTNNTRYNRVMRNALPLFFAGFITIISAKAQADSTLVYKGNTFLVTDLKEIVLIEDDATGTVDIRVENPDPVPIKMNDLMIYAHKDVQQPSTLTGEALRTYLLPVLQKNITTDGVYRIHITNVVLSEKGKIVYYNFGGVEKRKTKQSTNADQKVVTSFEFNPIDKGTNEVIGKQIETLIEKAPAYTPAKVANMNVVYRVPVEALKKTFFIKAGQVTFAK
jgi:hypothetical protein